MHADGWDEGYNGQEDVGSEVEKTDGKDCVPGGRPILALPILEIDETGSYGPIDPCSRVGVELDGKVVGRAGGRPHKDNDGHGPTGVLKCFTETQKRLEGRMPSYRIPG